LEVFTLTSFKNSFFSSFNLNLNWRLRKSFCLDFERLLNWISYKTFQRQFSEKKTFFILNLSSYGTLIQLVIFKLKILKNFEYDDNFFKF